MDISFHFENAGWNGYQGTQYAGLETENIVKHHILQTKQKQQKPSVSFIKGKTCLHLNSMCLFPEPFICLQQTQARKEAQCLLKYQLRARKVSLAGKSTACSSGGPKFHPQHPHDSLRRSCDSSPKESDALFWPPWASGMQMAQKHE